MTGNTTTRSPSPINGFTDLHASFGSRAPATASKSTRLGNRWQRLLPGDQQVWLGFAAWNDDSTTAVPSAEVAGWRLWASGPVFSYRGDTATPLTRFGHDLAEGRADAALLDAHAVLFGWNETDRELSVWTDRLGTVHAYQGGASGDRAVGTSLWSVTERSRRTLDWVAITGFCGFGFYPEDRTMYDDVRVLRPATCTVFDERGEAVRETRYWNWTHEPQQHRSDDDFLDEFDEIWSRTIATQLNGRRAVMPLSGGLDSRTLFAAATQRSGLVTTPVRTLTYGYSRSSVEIRISQQVAAARGQHAAEYVIEPYLLDRIDEVLDTVEGFGGLSFTRQAGVSDELSHLGDHVVGGHWGDVWFDTSLTSPPGDGPVDLVAAAHLRFAKRGREWLLDNVCAPHLDDDPETVLRDLLRAELGRVPDLSDPDMTLKALKTEQWSFRWTLPSVRAYQLGVPTLLPFYANDVVDYFLRVPSTRLPGRRLQTAYLRRHHPDLAAITWQDTGMSLYERRWEPAVALGRRAVAKAVRVALRRKAIERNWEIQYLGGDRPQRVQAMLTGSGERLGFSARLVEAFMDDFLASPNAGNGYALDTLLTLHRSLEHGEVA